MENATRITVLAAIIGDNTAQINSYFVSKSLPTPSFDADAPLNLMFDPNIAVARQALLEAMDELNSLILGPVMTIASLTDLASLKPIQRFKLAKSFKKEATFTEIASTSGLAEDQVKRIIRRAITHRVFQEPRKGIVAHTAASKLLGDNDLMAEWLGMSGDELWPAATRITEAISKWGDSGEPNHSGFNIAHNTDNTAFDEIAKYPERENRYATAMTWFSNGPGFEISHVVDNYPWAELEKAEATVVDIGGSHGNLCISIAEQFPSFQLVVQDKPDVVKSGRSKLPNHLQDRITFMEHDFFTEQPIKGADLYILRWILHDWSDSYAIRILKALIPALRHGSKILINEFIVPEVGSVSLYKDRHFRYFDFAMWQLHNGKERDLDDWVKLLKSADERFKLAYSKTPQNSHLGIIEVRWEDS